MPNPVDPLLRNFRPTNALALFFLFFLAGLVFIVQRWYSAFTATSCVVVYGAVLYAVQNRYQIELTDTVKDSPYFLGFSLTLVALWFVFDQAAGTESSRLSLQGLSGSIGAALGTTVAGILLRQTLHSRGVLEEERGAILRDLRNELTRHTKTFSESQSKLVALIEEFVATREELFSLEEQAARKYVDQIKKSGRLLERVDGEFRSHLKEFTQRLNRQLASFESAAEESTRQADEIRDALKTALSVHRKQSRELLETSLEQTERIQTNLSQTLSANERAIEEAVSRHEQRVRSLEGFAERYQKAEENAVASVRGLSQDLETVRSEVQQLRAALQELPSAVEQLPQQLEKATVKLGDDAERVSRALSENLQQIAEDVLAIDQIVDEVVNVLRERLRQVS